MDVRKKRTIEALLRAAEETFRGRTMDSWTLEEVADRAGVAVGSIYNHFGSKAGLLAAVVERALEADREFMNLAFTPDRTPAEQVYAAAEQYLQFYLEYPEYFRMLASPADPGQYPAGRELAERMACQIKQQNDRLVGAIQVGIDAGIARPVDAEKVAVALLAAWNGIISLNWRPDSLRRDEPELRKLLEAVVDVIAHGLLK
ncbi:TetR/AcrR family transcriptional regulator [Nocardia sp. BSTN01]|uniref:TetR/AcrR family transcriptional regulator n=1 Tax=Nocardia sp. BSTN01 TaxID=2783665 RepID=UPI00188FC06B|nr:TetR/AcrR family transcriptional regulator [Nocardia sp. BSTN01]MBF4998662.1 TetR/AcrR family transcriptional regulator [Nocardia sp. BSTN01]